MWKTGLSLFPLNKVQLKGVLVNDKVRYKTYKFWLLCNKSYIIFLNPILNCILMALSLRTFTLGSVSHKAYVCFIYCCPAASFYPRKRAPSFSSLGRDMGICHCLSSFSESCGVDFCQGFSKKLLKKKKIQYIPMQRDSSIK